MQNIWMIIVFLSAGIIGFWCMKKIDSLFEKNQEKYLREWETEDMLAEESETESRSREKGWAERSISLYHEKKVKQEQKYYMLSDWVKTVVVATVTTVLSLLFEELGIRQSNIVTVYILGVLVTAAITASRIYSLTLSVFSVLIFNFLFTAPKYTLKAYDTGYFITFGIMFLSALITSSLTVKLKNNAREAAQTAFRTQILFDMNQLLQQERDKKDILEVTAMQLIKLLNRTIVVYEVEKASLSAPHVYYCSEEEEQESYTTEEERQACLWVMKNNRHAGVTTKMFPNAKCLYLAVRVNNMVYGVIGIALGNSPMDTFEKSIVLSILGECALALENEQSIREKEEAAVMAQNEQLRANLLRAISHDLRTPLTVISGNASNLLSNEDKFDKETKLRLYGDIYDDSMWLINLVENLLSVTRIEDGRLNLKMSVELIDEVTAESIRHLPRKSAEYQIHLKKNDEFLMAKMDVRLILQVIINLIDNALKYTPPGSVIEVASQKKENMVEVSVSDNGPGISAEAKEHIFEMFYTGTHKIVDSRRSLGLGLSLCRSIIEAHEGSIRVEDNHPHGCIFTFTLPAEEVHLNE